MSPLLPPSEVAALLRVPPRLLSEWRSAGRGPKFIKVGRLVRYRAEDVQSWLDQQSRRTV